MKTVTIQMAGNLWKLLVKQGDDVQKGQEVAILESMKMEIPIVAEEAGVISKVYKAEGTLLTRRGTFRADRIGESRMALPKTCSLERSARAMDYKMNPFGWTQWRSEHGSIYSKKPIFLILKSPHLFIRNGFQL